MEISILDLVSLDLIEVFGTMMGWSQEVLFKKRRFLDIIWEGWQEFILKKKLNEWVSGWVEKMACIRASFSDL